MKKLFYLAMMILSAVTLEAADFKFAENGKTDYKFGWHVAADDPEYISF